MSIISKSMVKETSKFLLDICKVTTTTTFIVPYISGLSVAPYTQSVMTALSVALYLLSMILNRLADKMESER